MGEVRVSQPNVMMVKQNIGGEGGLVEGGEMEVTGYAPRYIYIYIFIFYGDHETHHPLLVSGTERGGREYNFLVS